jgi:hypothetical protein
MLFYLADIIMNYFTLRPDLLPKEYAYSLQKPSLKVWQRHYLTSFRPYVDLLSILPWDHIRFPGSRYLLLVRLIRTFNLAPIMMRSPIYIKMGKCLGKALGLGPSFAGMFALVFGLIAFLHIQACGISLFGKWTGQASLEISKDSSNFDIYTWNLMMAVGNVFYMGYK